MKVAYIKVYSYIYIYVLYIDIDIDIDMYDIYIYVEREREREKASYILHEERRLRHLIYVPELTHAMALTKPRCVAI